MDEQQELPLVVVNNSLKAIQGEPIKSGQQILQLIDQQTPTVWYGGVEGEGHDITICLVPNRINRKMGDETEDHHREILTVLKVHSSHLSSCSQYFETCLTERWSRSCSTFILETDTDVAYYTDCFSRMYTPTFHKDFKDIKYSLELLKVASQIQFRRLMDSTLLHISSSLWSVTDEIMIRLYSASPEFPRSHAQDLIVRLGMDESKEDCHKQLCDVVQLCIRTALGCKGNFCSSRALINELLPNSALSNIMNSGPSADSNVTRHVLMIVCRETKDMLVKVGDECDENQTFLSVPQFAEKISAICWILKALMAANVAEEVVECFVHLHALPNMLAIDKPPSRGMREKLWRYEERMKLQKDARDAAIRLAKLVLLMYQEVAAGKLLLKTSERVALLACWYSLLEKFSRKDNLDQAAQNLFSTLPLKQQMALVKSLFKNGKYEELINTNSLAKLLYGSGLR